MNILRIVLFLASIIVPFFTFEIPLSTASLLEFGSDLILLEPLDMGDQSLTIGSLATPSTTVIVNLPIIEQNVSQETPTPQDKVQEVIAAAALDTPTPTPTPIPQQTGATNLPIVIGALAIMIVVVLAWFFVSYLPGRKE